ncbi:MAG: hypothetical protein ACXVVK_13380 [Solirubrobacteraceae bacterium]
MERPMQRQGRALAGIRRQMIGGLGLMALCCMVGGLTPAASSATADCTLYASPSGSDSASGSLAHPLASVSALDRALAPGDSGCLESGRYGNMSAHGWSDLSKSGAPGRPITITAAPGANAKIVGLVSVSGNYTTLSGLTIDGSNTVFHRQQALAGCSSTASEGLEIDGHNDVFENNDLYQSVAGLRGNGIGIGWSGQANDTVVRFNRIHDVGQCRAFDQMIYLSHGDNVQIYDNWMWNDAHGWAVQVFPAATNAHIYDNVIDRAGSGFVVGGSSQVAGNHIDHNIVMNSTGLADAGLARGVGMSTCCGLGRGNTFTDNDVYANAGGIAAASGVAMWGNTTDAPALADPQNHNFSTTTVTPGALSRWGLWDGALGADHAMAAGAVRHSARRTVKHRTVKHRAVKHRTVKRHAKARRTHRHRRRRPSR